MSLAAAEEASKRSYDIPAGNAADALKQFSEQSGRGVMANGDLVKGIRTNAVKGEHAPVDALELLLADTGLVAIPDTKSGAFSIRKETVTEAKNVNRAIAESSRPGKSGKTELDEKGEPVVKLDTFEVFGRKTLNMDIRRSRDDIQPYMIIERADLTQSGALSLEDFLKTRLPMNAGNPGDLPSEQNGTQPFAPTSGTVNLRGLGAHQTLILVDGRRIASSSPFIGSGTFQQPSLNNIPLASIERIEVLPATAGAIYGGNATGGVINIVRKRDYMGIEMDVAYSNPFDTDAGRVEYAISGGRTFNSGRSSITFSISRAEANSLAMTDREFPYHARERQFQNNASLLAALTPPMGPTPNIARANASGTRFEAGPLVLDNGQVMPSPITHVPSGYAGPGSDGGSALVAVAGRYNYRTPGGAGALLRESTSGNFSFDVNHAITHRVEATVSVSGEEKSGVLTNGSTKVDLPFLATDARNPFVQPVIVALSLPQLVRPGHARNDHLQVSAGVKTRLSADWNAYLDYTWGRARFSYDSRSASPLSAAGIEFLKSVAFRDLETFPVDITPYVNFASDTFGGPFEVQSKAASIRAAGPLFVLPAGTIIANLLVENREEDAEEAYLVQPFVTTFNYDKAQRTHSAYLELKVPIVGEKCLHKWMHMAEIGISIRHDRYDIDTGTDNFSVLASPEPLVIPPEVSVGTRFDSLNYLIGARLAPNKAVSMRVSYGTGFLPPGLNQLVPAAPQQVTVSNILDPRRGNTPLVVPYTRRSGSNAELSPEFSQSLVGGLIFTPQILPGLRLSVDYTRTRKRDEITPANEAFLLQNEATLLGRITRGQNLPGDPSGWAGPVTEIDIGRINLLYSSVEALDIQLDYRREYGALGTFRLFGAASHILRFSRKPTLATAEFRSEGFSDGPLPWKAVTTMSWEKGPWMFGLSTQYYDSYSITFANPASAAANPTRILNQGSQRVGSQVYHDVFLNYTAPSRSRGLLSNVVLSVGVQNVGNTSPPIVTATSGTFPSLGYSAVADPRLRRFSISIRKGYGL